jgi:hypothetical protein
MVLHEQQPEPEIQKDLIVETSNLLTTPPDQRTQTGLKDPEFTQILIEVQVELQQRPIAIEETRASELKGLKPGLKNVPILPELPQIEVLLQEVVKQDHQVEIMIMVPLDHHQDHLRVGLMMLDQADHHQVVLLILEEVVVQVAAWDHPDPVAAGLQVAEVRDQVAEVREEEDNKHD